MPVFRAHLARLSITGWVPLAPAESETAKDNAARVLHQTLVLAFALRAVPPTCVLELHDVALAGLGDLFDGPAWPAAAEDDEATLLPVDRTSAGARAEYARQGFVLWSDPGRARRAV